MELAKSRQKYVFELEMIIKNGCACGLSQVAAALSHTNDEHATEKKAFQSNNGQTYEQAAVHILFIPFFNLSILSVRVVVGRSLTTSVPSISSVDIRAAIETFAVIPRQNDGKLTG